MYLMFVYLAAPVHSIQLGENEKAKNLQLGKNLKSVLKSSY